MAVGERAPDPGEQRLLDATIDAVAGAYAAQLDLGAAGEPIVGLVQQVYWDGSDPGHWAPLTLGIPERKAVWCAENGRLEALWWPYELPGLDVELAHVDVRADPAVLAACEALLRATEDEAAELARPYFLALARRLQALFGLPVVREDPDAGMADRRPDEALAELPPEQRAEWAARGWIEPKPEPELPPGTVLHVPTRPGRLAGIYRQGWRLYATTALDPVARRQPPSSGRSSGSAAIPRCSPGCCPPAPSAPACGSTASQAPSAVAASYGVDGNEAPERRARDLLEIRLEPRLGRRGAGRAAIEAELQALPATIDGREETLALVAASGVWVATWRDTRARRELAVIGSGAPPPRLDLVATTL